MQKKTKPVVAVDIGGTKIMVALFSAGGKMQAKDIRPTLVSEGVDAVIKRLYAAVNSILKTSELSSTEISAIGIACAGGIDTGRGVVVTSSPNLPGWAGLPLADLMKNKLGIATYVVNDAGAAALGEQRYGAGKGAKNLVLFTLGTGIGGGIIIDGKLYLGDRGSVGELGHMTVEPQGPRCGCGNTGCLEMLASGTAIVRDAIERIRKGDKSALVAMAKGKIDQITAETVGEAARNGDKLAQEVITQAAYYLGVGMINIANIFNPEMIIIGGGMAALGEMIIGQGRKMVAERAFSRNLKSVSIAIGRLGNEAGVYGAAAFAFDMRRAG